MVASDQDILQNQGHELGSGFLPRDFMHLSAQLLSAGRVGSIVEVLPDTRGQILAHSDVGNAA